jgi:glycosyltransferase involved in cell wall biosynthesis
MFTLVLMEMDDQAPADRVPGVRLSVIAPAHNEAENISRLVEEVGAALAGESFEFILVDDASTDDTVRVAQALGRPWLRIVTLSRPAGGGGNGQSAAFRAGFLAARGGLVASLDADLQNDPADLRRLLDELDRTGADFVQGDRSAARRQGDAWIRQVSSKVGRAFRRGLLGDTIRDTGCSLRVMRREIATRLPLEFKGMHRFIPVTARQLGYSVVELPVGHRPRHAGTPKYGAGIMTRALPGLIDCFAVRWMRARRRVPGQVAERSRAVEPVRDPVGAGA